jgi:hypothetical protein
VPRRDERHPVLLVPVFPSSHWSANMLRLPHPSGLLWGGLLVLSFSASPCRCRLACWRSAGARSADRQDAVRDLHRDGARHPADHRAVRGSIMLPLFLPTVSPSTSSSGR